MSRSGERPPDDSVSPPEQHASAQGAPLVIVSEQGRHSQASRRIVRAQAARASAAQSRVTRARNRDQRQGGLRESPLSLSYAASPFASPASADPAPQLTPIAGPVLDQTTAKPLTRWLIALLGLSVSGHGAIHPAFPSVPSPARLDVGSLQLPLALPRGFIGLQQAVDIAPQILTLLSRTACFDFGSQGVDQRLNHLLHDLILDPRTFAMQVGSHPGHPIEGYLRIACICLTIYQGQHADDQVLGRDVRYQDGMQAAWAEATALDPRALVDPKLAEVSLWVLFVIGVTTGLDTTSFLAPVRDSLSDLQLIYWEQVRRVLLDFIFPVSILDEPFRQFYQRITSVS